jgi:recombinational DNA repair protein (RecF pathway)
MLSVFNQLPSSSPKRAVFFSTEVNEKERIRHLREARKNVTRLFLQSDVAFPVDKAYALELLEKAKTIIDQNFSGDEKLISNYSNRKEWF